MAEISKDHHEHEGAVSSAFNRAEQFIEDNQKVLTIIFGAVLVIVAGYFGFKKLYLQPKEKEAQSQLFVAENYFEKDSFNLALNGSGNYPGFLQIIEEYGITKSANLAHYYAGICYLRTGKFNEAIEQLKKFKSNDQLIAPIAVGAQGDAYAELNNIDEAILCYKKAATKSKNEFTSPIYLMKAALLLETKKEFKASLKLYEEIKESYPKSQEGRQIEKYITRAELQIK